MLILHKPHSTRDWLQHDTLHSVHSSANTRWFLTDLYTGLHICPDTFSTSSESSKASYLFMYLYLSIYISELICKLSPKYFTKKNVGFFKIEVVIYLQSNLGRTDMFTILVLLICEQFSATICIFSVFHGFSLHS